MGTNFYWRTPSLPSLPEDDPRYGAYVSRVHIGKRSAAGQYCWDCDETLCKGGLDQIATGRSDWYERCPRCGGEKVKDGPNAAMVELGFEKSPTLRPKGVNSTAWFSWAQDPEKVGPFCEQHADEELIEDEYGHVMTCHAFVNMLASSCALQSTESVGREFS